MEIVQQLYYLHRMKTFFFASIIIISQNIFAQDTVKHFWYGRSIGKLPEIGYSLGEDRLGSAKMGYIDTGVVLKIIDSADKRYKIQLSDYHSAYIAKVDVARDSVFKKKPFYLTSNYNAVGGKDNYDTLFINTGIFLQTTPSFMIWTNSIVPGKTSWTKIPIRWKSHSTFLKKTGGPITAVQNRFLNARIRWISCKNGSKMRA